MKVLVTGASGFVGSHIADSLLDAGHEVRAVVRKSSSLTWLNDKPIEVVSADMTDPESLKPVVENVDAIVHVGEFRVVKNRRGFFDGTVWPRRALLEVSKRYNPTSIVLFS